MSSLKNFALQLRRHLEQIPVLNSTKDSRFRHIYEQTLESSPYLDRGNFSQLHSSDIERMFLLYDELFFARRLKPLVEQQTLSFRLSKRMTRSGGTTTRRKLRRGRGPTEVQYEIAIAAMLLLQTFRKGDRPVRVGGRLCRDRLEALQRILEHEMIHLAEMLVWEESSCSQPRFQRLAQRLFFHTEHAHELITPKERAFVEHGIAAGDRVQFSFQGKPMHGVVNRITRRATVLVPDARGQLYSDGQRYLKYYVPLKMLKRVNGTKR